MSLENCYWGNRGHCPICGQWIGTITGTMNDIDGLTKVTGICDTPGEVDITAQDWSWDDFDNGEV